jgi:hypothetical protein
MQHRDPGADHGMRVRNELSRFFAQSRSQALAARLVPLGVAFTIAGLLSRQPHDRE